MSLRMESYREFNRRFTNCSKKTIQETIFCSAIVGSNWQETIMTWTNIYQILGCATLFITLLYVRPKHLFHSYNDSRGCLVPNCPSVSLGHEIIIHLNVLQHWAYDLMFFTLWKYMDRLKRCMRRVLSKTTLNRRNRVFISLCSFFSFLIGLLFGTALGAIYIVTFIVTLLLLLFSLSPTITLYFFLLIKARGIIRSCVSINQAFYLPIAFVFSFLFAATQFFIIFTLSISVAFIVKTFRFTVMGFVLNAEVITPYVAFILIVTRNLHLCYSNLQTRYNSEVKGMIAEHWKENIRELPWLDKGHDQTIPKDLFWFVCGNGKSHFQKNILPLRAEICFILRDMVMTLTFLSVSLFAILAFKSMNDVSALVSTTFVFVSGVIPTLIFQGFTKKEKFSRWNKIKIEKRIKEAVTEYITRQRDDSLDRDHCGSFHWFFGYNRDTDSDFIL